MTSHLIIEYEKMVVKGQGSRDNHQLLMEGLDSNKVYEIITKYTFAAVLTTGEAVCVFATSRRLEETSNTYIDSAMSISSPTEVILARFHELRGAQCVV